MSTRIYAAAARLLAATALRAPYIRCVFVRRSVAAGEALFPWSDLDLTVVIEADSGKLLERLWRRFRLARRCFPRLGECLVYAPGEWEAEAELDPYRLSLDRRAGWVAAGNAPRLAEVPIPQREAMRRLVFLFEHYLPLAMRRRNGRNLRKFYYEIVNAAAVIDGSWTEPLISRKAVAERTGPCPADAFAACCRLAEQAHRQLQRPVPCLPTPVVLQGMTLIPRPDTPWPAETWRGAGPVLTPAVLDLLMETNNPGLWLDHRIQLLRLGFVPPSRAAWFRACRRWASGVRLRTPGFAESAPFNAPLRLQRAEVALGLLEEGHLPATPVHLQPPLASSPEDYYARHYVPLALRAAELRGRLARLQPFEGWPE